MATQHRMVIPVTTRKKGTATTADAAVALHLIAQLRVLVESILHALDLTQTLIPLAHESPLLCVRPAPPLIGIAVVTSDLAVRLFYAHGVRHSTATSENEAGQAFASSIELAAFCAHVMERTRRQQPSEFAGITRVTVPDDAAHSAGVLGDRILIHTREYARLNALPTPLESRIVVLFHDDAVVVVHKPHGMLSVDGNLCEHNTTIPVLSVQRLVRQYYADARMVHRLDQETSGILVVALTRSAAQHLNQQFRDRTIDKTYMARVLGHVEGESGVIEVCMAPSKTEKLVQRVVDHGAATRTEWRVLERSSLTVHGDSSVTSTLLELKPVTGKTHQLRVHMEHLGHPILGDSLYSPARVHSLAPRLFLHAAAIQFCHPVTYERMTITCPCAF